MRELFSSITSISVQTSLLHSNDGWQAITVFTIYLHCTEYSNKASNLWANSLNVNSFVLLESPESNQLHCEQVALYHL